MISITRLERLIIWNYWLVSREMSDPSCIIPDITTTKEGHFMNLDEFKAHIIATRQASKAEALSVLSATITKSTTTKGDN